MNKTEMLGLAKGYVKNSGYRIHTAAMDAGVKMFPQMFPFPEIEIGSGCRTKIPQLLKKYGISKVMIVTGPTVGKTIVPSIADNITASGISCVIFDRTEANPSIQTVEEIKDMYITAGCNGFLAVGGGSPMDAAKVAAARIAKPRQEIGEMAGMMKILRPVPPIICVPTTAGTGSEVTIGAVISDHEKNHKYAITDPFITPKAAVIDAELTLGLPPFVTATTGIDALTHAVESYITRAYNTDFTNRCCEEAVVKIFRNIDRAYQSGSDLKAREQMIEASYKAGLAFTRTGVGYVHGIAHAMGGLYNTAHGLANSVILPIVLEDYGDCVHEKLAHLAEITGVCTEGGNAAKAKAFIAAIRAMNARMGLPTGFDFIKSEDYNIICKWALAEVNVNYPVPVLYDERRLRHLLNRIVTEA